MRMFWFLKQHNSRGYAGREYISKHVTQRHKATGQITEVIKQKAIITKLAEAFW